MEDRNESMVPEVGGGHAGRDAAIPLHSGGLDEVGGSIPVSGSAGAHAELPEVPELPRQLGDEPVLDPVLPGVAAVVGGIGSVARGGHAAPRQAADAAECHSFPLISESSLAGPPKHKFRFYHPDLVKGIEIPYVMWLDERMRVSSLQVDPERPVSALPGFASPAKPSGVKIIRNDSTGERTILAIPEVSVEATRLLDSTVPLQDARQEAIRLRMLREISVTIEDPSCPSQACTANSIKRKYRQQMELTLGGGS